MVLATKGSLHCDWVSRTKPLPHGWDARARRIGVRLQQARQVKGLSQEAVAHAAGISTYTYQKFEKGESKPRAPMNPRLTTLLALCDALSITVAELVGDVDADPKCGELRATK